MSDLNARESPTATPPEWAVQTTGLPDPMASLPPVPSIPLSLLRFLSAHPNPDAPPDIIDAADDDL